MLNKIIKFLLLIISIITSTYLTYTLYKISIIPNKYLIPIIILVIIINIINIILMLLNKKLTKVISIILSIIITIITIIGSFYISRTDKFLGESFNNNIEEITTYSIVIRANRYDNISKLNNKKLGYYINNNEEDILKKLDELITTNKVKYEDIYELYDELISKELDAILIDTAYLDVLSETNEDLDSQITILYSFDITTKIEKQQEQVNELKPINIYISGSDSRSPTIYNKSRSDVNMILTINPYTKEILITSIPRDYYVQVHGQTGLKDKLTHSGIYGLDVSEKTVEDLFDIDIDYSVKINFNAVTEVVDLVGGIEVYSDTTFNSSHKPGWVVKEGMNYMDGEKALAYSRERYAYRGGDRHRIQNQQQVLEAVLKKIMTDKKILLQYDELLTSLSNLYRTDIPKEVITLYVKDQLENMSTWTFTSYKVDGSNASLPTHTAPKSKRYVMIPYEEDVNEAHNKITKLINKK
ncbi:MAG: LCP family protein [Candidatus Coprovivens sp.]